MCVWSPVLDLISSDCANLDLIKFNCYCSYYNEDYDLCLCVVLCFFSVSDSLIAVDCCLGRLFMLCALLSGGNIKIVTYRN